ncbi:hypothetical protein I3843_14G123400 [Carya illinoinensis]|uniref:Glycosyltransferase n=1 Tax=Carya illinoinensis TaxID=32201 RepID=A0A922AKB8_CARIL|nr:UDP-glycosyltransferase 92A1-like [Carya illinoinensis]KAG6679350.1 hypothetical protein I3842_14G126000 [Carya illinoinensis]KAG7948000.1 hypothetical protein I3843_14G123400 [Carya illinoinensis]
MSETKEHFILFPFMAEGHIIPFLALALRLVEKKGCTITFINTPLNIKKISAKLPPNPYMRLVEIPFNPADHGLPADAESTNSLPYHLILSLFEASDSFKPIVRKLIHNIFHEENGCPPPHCFISDLYFGWCADIAHEFGMYHTLFSPSGAFGMACYFSICLHLPQRKAESEEFTLPDFPEASTIHISQLSQSLKAADGNDSFSRYMTKLIPQCLNSDGMLVNTVEGLDTIGLDYFRRKFNRPIWAVGPLLLPPSGERRVAKDSQNSPEFITSWLDSKPPKSVLYISFGSQNTMSSSQMMQLAMGLDVSGKNFIWVVRPPMEFDINSEFNFKEWLPEGFAQKIRDEKRGLILDKWAPQQEILSHEATSAFLSHCGWNSVLECLIHGIPLIGWPMATEQFYNAKHMGEQVGVCVEVARGKTCEVKHEDIAAMIELVMNETEKAGKTMRRKALEAREILFDAMKDEDDYKGSSVKAMDDFLSAAELMSDKTKRGPNI